MASDFMKGMDLMRKATEAEVETTLFVNCEKIKPKKAPDGTLVIELGRFVNPVKRQTVELDREVRS